MRSPRWSTSRALARDVMTRDVERDPRRDGARRGPQAPAALRRGPSSSRPSRCSADGSSEREPGRFEITHVPAELRNRDRQIGAGVPVLRRYERVTFEKHLIAAEGKPLAELRRAWPPPAGIGARHHPGAAPDSAAPGGGACRRSDPGTEPRVLVFLEHAVTDAREDGHGNRRTVSRRFEFVRGHRGRGAAARQLCALPRPAASRRRASCPPLARSSRPWAGCTVTLRTERSTTGSTSCPRSISPRSAPARWSASPRSKAAVQERLTREVTYWDHRASELQLQADAGRSPRMNPDRAAARADELQRRKEARLAELDREAQLASQLPVVVGAALVLPMGLIRQATGEPPAQPPDHALDTTVIERRAVDAVLAVEATARPRCRGDAAQPPRLRHPLDAAFWRDAVPGGQGPHRRSRHVRRDPERAAVRGERSRCLCPGTCRGLSSSGPEHDQVRYLTRPYGADVRLPFDTTSTTLSWHAYRQRATPPLDA